MGNEKKNRREIKELYAYKYEVTLLFFILVEKNKKQREMTTEDNEKEQK